MIQNLHNPLQWNAQFREPVASEWLTHGTPWNKNQFSFNTWPEAGLGEAPTKTVPAEPDFAICWATLRLKRLLFVCYCLIEVGKWSVMSIDDRLNYEPVQDVMYGLVLECEPIWTWHDLTKQDAAKKCTESERSCCKSVSRTNKRGGSWRFHFGRIYQAGFHNIP